MDRPALAGSTSRGRAADAREARYELRGDSTRRRDPSPVVLRGRTVQIQVNADKKIESPERLQEHVRDVVEKALKKVRDHVTRVEVHLTKESAQGAEDIKCVMEARLERTQPTAVTHHAPSVHLAADGAAEKLERALSHIIGKRRDGH